MISQIASALEGAGIPCQVENTGGHCDAIVVRGTGPGVIYLTDQEAEFVVRDDQGYIQTLVTLTDPAFMAEKFTLESIPRVVGLIRDNLWRVVVG